MHNHFFRLLVTLLGFVFFVFLAIGSIDEQSGSLKTRPVVQKSAKTKIDIANKSGLERIDAIVKNVGQFSTSCFTNNSNIATQSSKPPYEVIVNAPLNNYSDCGSAKRDAYYVLEAIYNDSEINNKISRVLVTCPPFVRVSLGATDGIGITKSGS